MQFLMGPAVTVEGGFEFPLDVLGIRLCIIVYLIMWTHASIAVNSDSILLLIELLTY